jgi:hypothetical protein
MYEGVLLLELLGVSFLTLLILPGFVLLLSRSRFFSQSTTEPLQLATTATSVSFAFLNVLGFFIANNSQSPKIAFRIYFWGSVLTFSIFLFKSGLKKYKPVLLYTVFALAVATWQILPWLLILCRSGSALGMFAANNLDVVNYVAVANEYLNTGFANSHHICCADINSFALHGTPQGPTVLMGFLASGLGISSWQAATPTIIVASGFASLGVSRLVRAFYVKSDRRLATTVAAIVMMSSLISYVYLNYFLGQILAIGVSALLLANMLEYTRGIKNRKLLLLEIVALSILSIFTYPVFLIPFLILTLILALAVSFTNRKQVPLHFIIYYLAAILLGILFAFPYFAIAITLFKFLLPVVAGWPISPLNPVGMFLAPQLIGVVTPNTVLAISWIVVLLLIGMGFRRMKKRHTEKIYPGAFLIIGVAAILSVPIIRRHGFADYQTWKLISYFLPLFLAAAIPVLFYSVSKGGDAVVLLLGITIMSTWAYYPLSQASQSYITKEMIEASSSPDILDQKILNIDVTPGFESMSLANMINGPKINTLSKDLWMTNPNRYACTLVRIGNPNYFYIKPLNKIYGIATNKNGSCGA